jgi:LPXTG-motif cell wall-anchored protein
MIKYGKLLVMILAFNLLVLNFGMQINAKEAPDLEELVQIAREGEAFAYLLSGNRLALLRLDIGGEDTRERCQDFYDVFVEKGYFPKYLSEEGSEYDEVPFYYFSVSEEMQDKSAWTKELRKYFTDDHWRLLDRLTYKDGNLYLIQDIGEHFPMDLAWDTGKISSSSDDEVVVEFKREGVSDYVGDYFKFVRTEEGWRISESNVMDQYIFVSVPELPKTGEHTGLYALIFTLAVLPLAGIGVYRWRKRRVI